MERLILTARIDLESSEYVARVENLPIEAKGDSLEKAQEELIQVMRIWIENHDGTETLEEELAQAGFPGVGEDTELQLEFVE